MNIKKLITVGVAGMAMGVMALDYVEVTDVKARERYPWNGLVDIDFELDSKATEPYFMKVTVFDNIGKTNLPVKTVCTEKVSQEANPCMVTKDTTRIVWNAAEDLPDGFKCPNVLVTCQDERTVEDSQKYMIVDLSAGSGATSYAVSYASCPPTGGWTSDHKTNKLVLRKVNAGSFMMGSPSDEIGRKANENYHKVTLTKDFYIGIFEVTEKQYAQVKGGSGSSMKAVLTTYANTRGDHQKKDGYGYRSSKSDYCWPDSVSVDSSSFVGLLRSKTPIKSFDLPTEAQWEYVAKSGCVRGVYTGSACSSSAVNEVGRNINNKDDGKGEAASTTITYVGQYMPNALGIYDMLGNAAEWCVDAYKASLGTAAVTDPKGGTATIQSYNQYWIYRVIKGGGVVGGHYIKWHDSGWYGNGYNSSFMPYNACRPASRATTVTGTGSTGQDIGESSASVTCGFRVMCFAE